MKQYLEALQYILDNGELVENRTGINTLAVFGYQMRFNLSEGFPAVTTKRLAWKAVVGELLWFLEGSTDERRLAEITYEKPREELKDKTTIWTANADKQGIELGYGNNPYYKGLGPVYGHQWRNFAGDTYNDGVDQIYEIVNQLVNNPDSRRIILSAWSTNQLDFMALPPCHVLSQFRVVKGKLSCQLYQRSADMFLGVPFNIASYALLTHILADVVGLKVGEFIWTGGDCHIYANHIEQVKEQLSRTPNNLPKLQIPDICSISIKTIESLKVSDFKLLEYEPQASIKAEMAV